MQGVLNIPGPYSLSSFEVYCLTGAGYMALALAGLYRADLGRTVLLTAPLQQ